MLPEKETPVSPLEGLSVGRFGRKTYLQETLITVGVTQVTLIRNNPNRIFWAAINEGVNDVRLSTDPTITALSGWILAANGGLISMFWEQDGESVGYACYAISGVAGMVVRVREVILE